MSKNTNKKALKAFVKELKVAVKEYAGDFEGLVHYVQTTPSMQGLIDNLEEEELASLSARAAKAAARAAKKLPKPVELDADGNPIVRKRGRPKGSKNKPRVVEAAPAEPMPAAPAEASV